MKKLVVLSAFAFATMTANQAVACDMGAIEAWVAAACQRNGCGRNQLLKSRLRAVLAQLYPSFILMCDLSLSKRLTDNDSLSSR